MANSQDLGKIQDLRETLGKGDEKRAKAQREAGKLTARERILKIADVGSFVELYAFVSEQDEGAGVVTGYATVQQRPVYLFAQDFTGTRRARSASCSRKKSIKSWIWR